MRSSRIPVLLSFVVVVAACAGSNSTTTTVGVTSPEPSENESFGSYMTRCFAEFGIAATQMGDSAVFVPDSQGQAQRDTQREAAEKCDERATEAGIVEYLDRSDPVALADRYAALVEVYECLADHDLAGEGPPSEEVYNESGGLWNPYDSMGRANRIEGDEVCPSEFFSHTDSRDYGIGDPGPSP